MRKLWMGAIGLLIATSIAADVVKIKDDVPERYVVKKGDTLWDISNMFLDDPWLWPEIWQINEQIEDPHLIYPGDVIGFRFVDGKPVVTNLSRTDTVNVNEDGYIEEEVEPGLVKLRPTARIYPRSAAIPAIPRELISGFLSDNAILDEGVLEAAPYIVSGFEGRLILGAGDKIYARGDFSQPLPAYDVYRPGEAYIDPETKELLGYEGLNLGILNYRTVEDDIATLLVQSSVQNVSLGDRLLESDEEALTTTFYPSAPNVNVSGNILSVNKGVKMIGQYDVVLLNKGERDGLREGNIMQIWAKGEQVRDPITSKRIQLPSEQAGLLMVFKTFSKLSYGLVMEAEYTMRVGDEVRSPGFL